MKFTERRMFVWLSGLYEFSGYDHQNDSSIPVPHTSGDWMQGFRFNNDHWLQLAVL